MDEWLIILLIYEATGLVGAISRVFFMRLGHGTWCKWDEAIVFLFFGLVGGGIAYQLGEGYLSAGATGFMMSDIISQLAQAWAVRVNGD